MRTIIENEANQSGGEKLPRASTFEDLIVWQKARVLTKRIYEATRSEVIRKDYGFVGQAQRAAVSIMANVAEGFDRRGTGEFLHFLSYAKGPCAELHSHLSVALDCNHINPEEFSELKAMADEVSRLVQSLITSLQKSAKRVAK